MGKDSSVEPGSGMRLAYLCLQATREGQASRTHVTEIVDGLALCGWDVTTFQPRYTGSHTAPRVAHRLIAFLAVQLRCVLSMARFDVLYVRDHPAAILTIWGARILRKPIVLEVNGLVEELVISYPRLRPAEGLIRLIGKLRTMAATAAIVVTPQLKSRVAEMAPSKRIAVIPNGADPERFRPAAKYGSQSPYVAFVGVLAPWQGLQTLIEATGTSRWPALVRLKIAGDGALRSFVSTAAAESEVVEYLGLVPASEVPMLLANSRAALSPKGGNLESLTASGLSPVKLYEGMSCGVPVIVSDIAYQSEIVRNHECGLVVRPNDPVALADAVARIVEDQDMAAEMGTHGREAVVQQYSWRARSEETDEFIRSVISA